MRFILYKGSPLRKNRNYLTHLAIIMLCHMKTRAEWLTQYQMFLAFSKFKATRVGEPLGAFVRIDTLFLRMACPRPSANGITLTISANHACVFSVSKGWAVCMISPFLCADIVLFPCFAFPNLAYIFCYAIFHFFLRFSGFLPDDAWLLPQTR